MITVGSLLNGGIGLVRSQPKAVAIWGALYLILTLGMLYAIRPFVTSMAAIQQAQLAGGTPQLPVMPQGLGLFALAYLALIVAVVSVFAAAVRATAKGGDDAAAFLRLGMDELRLIGLGVIFVIAFIVLEIVALIVFGLIVGLGSLGGPLTGSILGAVLGLALLCAFVWVEVRLSLTGAMTVLRGKIIVGDAWRETRGHFWTLFATFLILTTAYLVLTIVVVGVTNPAMFAAYAGGMKPAAMAGLMQAQSNAMANGLPIALIVQSLIGAVVGAVTFAIVFGTVATAAIALSGDQGVATIFE